MVHEEPTNPPDRDGSSPGREPEPAVPAAAGLNELCSKLGDGYVCGARGAEDLARELGAVLRPGDWIFLEGDLGAGKTTFVQWLLGSRASTGGADSDADSGSDPAGFVTSPTYALCHSYEPPQNLADRFLSVVHMDLYRVRHDREIFYLGLDDMLSSRTLVVVEWAEQVSQQGWRQLWSGLDGGAPRRLIHLSISWAGQAEGLHDDKRRYVIRVLPT